jgi:hypothetical protein
MSTQPAPAPFIPAVVGTPSQAVMPTAPTPKKEIPSTQNKVVGAKIVLSYLGEDGKIYEAGTTIAMDDFKVQSYSLNVEEKHEKKRDPETKDIIGFEDTGERVLTFKLRYHVR